MADVKMQRDGREADVHEDSVKIMQKLGWEKVGADKAPKAEKKSKTEKAQ